MPRWIAHAEHILECIAQIESVRQRGSLQQDRILYAATLRFLQTMSEATQHLPESLKNVHSAIPWQEISGFRNILVHNYLGEIDPTTIQSIIQNDLPALRNAVNAMLESHQN
ncbi:MAG: HepT-like ribonuclease domain-containing protein [Wenzhouxiangellaceae bacterium]|nr:HepT-like ribonuclease domain-containing protein [Wenzhouxiangellaceae bacterium]